MADPTEAILAYLRQVGASLDLDFIREAVRVMSVLLMEIEVKHQIGAGRYERTEERTTYRNGYRDRDWQTRVGEIPLKIPKPREGSYFPSLLEPRRQAEQALLSVIQPAEHLWPLTNSVLVNRHFASIEELEDAQAERCIALQARLGLIRRATRFHWWPQRIRKRQGPRRE
jgi:Transposase, Mutator family